MCTGNEFSLLSGMTAKQKARQQAKRLRSQSGAIGDADASPRSQASSSGQADNTSPDQSPKQSQTVDVLRSSSSKIQEETPSNVSKSNLAKPKKSASKLVPEPVKTDEAMTDQPPVLPESTKPNTNAKDTIPSEVKPITSEPILKEANNQPASIAVPQLDLASNTEPIEAPAKPAKRGFFACLPCGAP